MKTRLYWGLYWVVWLKCNLNVKKFNINKFIFLKSTCLTYMVYIYYSKPTILVFFWTNVPHYAEIPYIKSRKRVKNDSSKNKNSVK
jgi:hypothetical protein